MDLGILAVYDPPSPGLPFLVVILYPDGKAVAVPAESAEEAQATVERIASETGATLAGED
jgi:hypothetical protein